MKTLSLNSILESLGGERRIDYSLDRFKAALAALKNPEKDVYSLIIGGTNGKGMTTLLVSSVLHHAGHKVATYLSPHLQSPSERFLLGMTPIDEGELTELANEFVSVAKKHDLTYFEFLTLLNFVQAKRVSSDFLVLEVGLGGRLDATNVTDPLACAITNIDFDHQAFLGKTLPEILEEKLAIVNAEGLLFTGIEDAKLLERVEQRCLELDTIYYYAKELSLSVSSTTWRGQNITLNGYPFFIQNTGPGAVKNAALAFLMSRIVFPKLTLEQIQIGFSQVTNPGRLEVVQESPRVVLSGDHNPAGIACLKQALSELPYGKLKIVCGFSPDKPYLRMYETLKGLSDEILLTAPGRARDKYPRDYWEMGDYEQNPKKAVEKMLEGADPSDTILVTGSLYLVGEVRSLWHPRVEFLANPLRALAPSVPAPGDASPARSRKAEEAQTRVLPN